MAQQEKVSADNLIGQVFWLPDDGGSRTHLNFIIAGISDEGTVLLVNMTSFRGFSDEDITCILHKGDHESIRHDSWIRYQSAREEQADFLIKIISNGELRSASQLSPVILKKIQEGALVTKRLSRKFQQKFFGSL